MKTDVLAPLFAALGHETRLKVFALLAQSGSYAASELAQATGLSPSALSFHLKDLRLAGLVDHRREGRQVFYQADQNAVDLLAHFLLRDCGPDPTAPDSRLPDILELLLSPGRQAEEQASGGKGRRGTAHPRQVLFLCTGNSARSIMAESLLRHFGQDRFVAHSAGSHPRGEIDSVTLEVLKAHGLPTTNLRSKIWEGFSEDSHAKPLDIIIT
ncbi:MAG: metalloregulator ArsR/SmtB family transcription factor, partial [Mangrovicoccus sp.]